MKSEFLYIVALVTLKNALSQYITAIKSKYQNKILTEIMTVSEEEVTKSIVEKVRTHHIFWRSS